MKSISNGVSAVAAAMLVSVASPAKADFEEELSDYRTEVRVLETCPAAQARGEKTSGVEAAVLGVLIEPLLAAGVTAVGDLLEDLGAEKSATPVSGSASDPLYTVKKVDGRVRTS